MILSLMLAGCLRPDPGGCADLDGDGYYSGLCDSALPWEDTAGDDCADCYPAPEICDGVDNDLDGFVDEEQLDSDGDGEPDCTDCLPGDASVAPGVPESHDGVDEDCNGIIDDGFPPEVAYLAIQDLLRDPSPQPISFGCLECPSDFAFVLVDHEGHSDTTEVVDLDVTDGYAIAMIAVMASAQTGFYDLIWTAAGTSGTLGDAVRVSRGQVRIEEVSPSVFVAEQSERLDVIVEGWNFEEDSLVHLGDAGVDEVGCMMDDIAPERVSCHFADTLGWSIPEGDTTLSVRDAADVVDCGGWTQACVEVPVVR